jgi:AcrR family transcriptional regulator
MRKKSARRKTARQSPALPRRSNAERSASTRTKLIDAAIELLHTGGYSATTTILVADHARVSRGAMLHQFPTRIDLLVAVAQHIVDGQRRYIEERIYGGALSPGMERLPVAQQASWHMQSQPTSIALLEIMLATRNDAQLAKRLAPIVKQRIAARRDAVKRATTESGLTATDARKLETLIELHQASLRGLALELMFTRDAATVENSRQLLMQYERTFLETLVPRP